MISLVLANLVRRKGRTAATALGVALGVATIVALTAVGSGLKDTAGQLVRLGSSDLGLFQAGVADPTASVLPVALAQRLERRADVDRATPLLLIVEGIRQEPAAVVFGADPGGFFAERLLVTGGTAALGARDLLLGDRLAGQLKTGPGATVIVKGRRLTVRGVFHTGIFFEDSGAVVALSTAQRILGRPQEATTVAVQLAAGVRRSDAVRSIRRALPTSQVLDSGDDAVRAGANGEVVRKAVTLVAALALLVGGLGVANTLALSVLERRHELALLSAVGWRPARIVGLVLAEGVVTSALGAAAGVVLGAFGAGWLADGLGVSAIVDPDITGATIARALLVGAAIGVLGGLYPAWRASRASGAELLA